MFTYKGGSRYKNWYMAWVLSFLIRYFSNYYILHRSDLAAWAAPLDPRLYICIIKFWRYSKRHIQRICCFFFLSYYTRTRTFKRRTRGRHNHGEKSLFYYSVYNTIIPRFHTIYSLILAYTSTGWLQKMWWNNWNALLEIPLYLSWKVVK